MQITFSNGRTEIILTLNCNLVFPILEFTILKHLALFIKKIKTGKGGLFEIDGNWGSFWFSEIYLEHPAQTDDGWLVDSPLTIPSLPAVRGFGWL